MRGGIDASRRKRIDSVEAVAKAMDNLLSAVGLMETIKMAAGNFASDREFGTIYYALEVGCTNLRAAFRRLEQEVGS